MVEQAKFDQSPGEWSVMRYSEYGESQMGKGNDDDNMRKGGGVSDAASQTHVMTALPCVVKPGEVTLMSDEDGNCDMTSAKVEWVQSDVDEDGVEITKVTLGPGVERGKGTNHPRGKRTIAI